MSTLDHTPIHAETAIPTPALVACQLPKYCHWIEDTEGFCLEFRYLRDTDRREVDFVVHRGDRHYQSGKLTVLPFTTFCPEFNLP